MGTTTNADRTVEDWVKAIESAPKEERPKIVQQALQTPEGKSAVADFLWHHLIKQEEGAENVMQQQPQEDESQAGS